MLGSKVEHEARRVERLPTHMTTFHPKTVVKSVASFVIVSMIYDVVSVQREAAATNAHGRREDAEWVPADVVSWRPRGRWQRWTNVMKS